LNIDPKTGKVESIDWQVIPVNSDVPEDPDFAAVTRKYEATLRSLAKPVGRTRVALDARSEENRTRETNVGNLVADSFRRATGAEVALVNGGSVRADTVITPGALTVREVLSILPFNNELAVLEVDGALLRQALEHGVGRTAPGAEPGRFPQVSGLRYSFDASLPAGQRIKDVTVGGRPLDPARTYTLVTTRYLAEGGDQYEMLRGAKRVTKSKVIDSDALRRMITTLKTIAPRVEGRIRRLDSPAAETPCAPAGTITK
jgi:5'-nucleotidase